MADLYDRIAEGDATAFDAWTAHLAHIAALESIVRELADEVEATVRVGLSDAHRADWGAMRGKFDRDMDVVHRARALLDGGEG